MHGDATAAGSVAVRVELLPCSRSRVTDAPAVSSCDPQRPSGSLLRRSARGFVALAVFDCRGRVGASVGCKRGSKSATCPVSRFRSDGRMQPAYHAMRPRQSKPASAPKAQRGGIDSYIRARPWKRGPLAPLQRVGRQKDGVSSAQIPDQGALGLDERRQDVDPLCEDLLGARGRAWVPARTGVAPAGEVEATLATSTSTSGERGSSLRKGCLRQGSVPDLHRCLRRELRRSHELPSRPSAWASTGDKMR